MKDGVVTHLGKTSFTRLGVLPLEMKREWATFREWSGTSPDRGVHFSVPDQQEERQTTRCRVDEPGSDI